MYQNNTEKVDILTNQEIPKKIRRFYMSHQDKIELEGGVVDKHPGYLLTE